MNNIEDKITKGLFVHFNKFVEVSEIEFQEIKTFFDLHKFRKKEIFVEAGHNCNFNYFVLKGCLHMFFISDKGTERTVQFAIENWWMTDYLAFLKHGTTGFYIQAVENTQVFSISYEHQEKLLSLYPKLERYFRIISQVSYGASLMKIKYIYDLSKEDMYFHFIEQFPEFVQRVPQYLIASFLGLTPEYVSEIRNKRRS